MKRRHLLIGAAGTIAAPAIVRAQAKYPDRTIKIVVPFAPAGPTDIIGRKAAEKLTALLGQTVIVENKAGAAGSIGAVEVKNAKPDGYTFLFAPSSTHAINPTAFVKPAYDAVKDFTPVSSVCVNPLVLVTHPSMPDSVMGLVELMKKNPGKYEFASSSPGTAQHLGHEAGGEFLPLRGAFRPRQGLRQGEAPDHGGNHRARGLHEHGGRLAFGEAVQAVVVLHAGAKATESEILDWWRDRIAGFKRPRAVTFLAEEQMPRTATGKVLHRELRDLLARRPAS